MGYRIYSFSGKGHHGSEAEEFFEAAEMARKSVEKMHHLASEMEDRYGERFYGDRYGMRGDYYGMRHDGYGEREMWDEPMMHERRRRDSMGRYM